MINQLINKPDTFEIVRDRIAQILANESANQQALATNQGQDADLWKLNVMVERVNPLEFLQSTTGYSVDYRGAFVNVWFDNETIETNASQIIDRQQMLATFNIDIYQAGFATNSENGYVKSDEAANKKAQRSASLVRNILMNDQYVTLGFPKNLHLIGQKLITSIQPFNANQNDKPAVHVGAVRLVMQCKLREFTDPTIFENLEELHITVQKENGFVLAQALYQK